MPQDYIQYRARQVMLAPWIYIVAPWHLPLRDEKAPQSSAVACKLSGQARLPIDGTMVRITLLAGIYLGLQCLLYICFILCRTVSTRSEYPTGNLGQTAPFLAMVMISQFTIVHLMVVLPYNKEICLCWGLYCIYKK